MQRLIAVRPSRLVAPLALIIVLAVGLYRGGAIQGAGGTQPLVPLGDFEATVHYGPDAGWSRAGILYLARLRDGVLTGWLVPRKGAQIHVTGQQNGLALALVLYVGNGKVVYGAGSFGHDPSTRKWLLGGLLTGPRSADVGDWGLVSSCFTMPTPLCSQLLGGIVGAIGGVSGTINIPRMDMPPPLTPIPTP